MAKREYKIVKWDNYNEYFKELIEDDNLNKEFLSTFTFKEHSEVYLKICLWNLYEKHLRGQKDFTNDVWSKIEEKFGGLMK